jgi:hypothetical protein
MREAIKFVFDKSQHRNCRWHITRMRDYELEELYKLHKDKNLRERLESLINYPLGIKRWICLQCDNLAYVCKEGA